MISWNEACIIVGYNPCAEPPTRTYRYFAYKSGNVKAFSDPESAKAFSNNVEKCLYNQTEIVEFWKKQRKFEQKAADKWKSVLRADYSHLSDKVFDLCYSKAWEDGHSAGYDEVASHVSDYAEFAEKTMELSDERTN